MVCFTRKTILSLGITFVNVFVCFGKETMVIVAKVRFILLQIMVSLRISAKKEHASSDVCSVSLQERVVFHFNPYLTEYLSYMSR